jgi:hypothetical protein
MALALAVGACTSEETNSIGSGGDATGMGGSTTRGSTSTGGSTSTTSSGALRDLNVTTPGSSSYVFYGC